MGSLSFNEEQKYFHDSTRVEKKQNQDFFFLRGQENRIIMSKVRTLLKTRDQELSESGPKVCFLIMFNFGEL